MEKDTISSLLEVYRVPLLAFLHVVLPKGNPVNVGTAFNQFSANIPGGITGTKQKTKT